jgi:hypothetical protein
MSSKHSTRVGPAKAHSAAAPAHEKSRTPAIGTFSPAVAGLGNQAMQAGLHAALLAGLWSGTVHAKLKIGGTDDPEERSADRTADQIMAGGAAAPCACGGTCPACNDDMLRRKDKAAPTPEGGGSLSLSGGRALDRVTRAFFEPRLGRDLSRLEIHTGAQASAQARALAARAFTIGNDIVFGEGEYRPGTHEGNWLLAHELAHVVRPSPSVVRRQPLDPSNPQAWDWYASKQHRDSSFLQTVDRASKDAAELTKGFADAKAPATDEEREAMDKRIETLIRLKAVSMVAAHRAELVKRKEEFQAMLAPGSKSSADQAPGTAPATSEADRKSDTVKAIRSASQSVINLNAWKEQLTDLRDHISAAVELNAGPETIKDEFEILQKNAYPEPPKDLQAQIDATRAQMRGVSWATRKLKLIDLRNYLVGVRNQQISAIDASIATFYDSFPFLADLSAEYIMTGHKLGKTTRGIIGGGIAALLSPILGPVGTYLSIDEDKPLDDERLLAEVRSSFDRLLENTDAAIAKVGSGGIEPLELPGAVSATRASLPALLQAELDRMKEHHEAKKFAIDMALALGIAVLTGLTGGLAGVGLAGWAAAGGATTAAIGAGQLAVQAKEMLDRQTLAAAATSPEGELLGVSAPSTLEKVLFGVGVVLTAVDLAGVLKEIKTLKPHFVEEPHVPTGAKGLADEEGGAVSGEAREAEGAKTEAAPGRDTPEEHPKPEEGPKLTAEHPQEINEFKRNMGNVRRSETPGYTHEIPGEDGHVWRRSSDGVWCRFSAKFCIPKGAIPEEEEGLRIFEENETARRTLRDNLVRRGVPMPPGKWQAHHIIPWEWRNEPAVIRARQQFGWDMNSIENGVPLPVSTEEAGGLGGVVSTHRGSHAAYSSDVWSDLDQLHAKMGQLSDDEFYEEFQRLIDKNRRKLISEFGGTKLP